MNATLLQFLQGDFDVVDHSSVNATLLQFLQGDITVARQSFNYWSLVRERNTASVFTRRLGLLSATGRPAKWESWKRSLSSLRLVVWALYIYIFIKPTWSQWYFLKVSSVSFIDMLECEHQFLISVVILMVTLWQNQLISITCSIWVLAFGIIWNCTNYNFFELYMIKKYYRLMYTQNAKCKFPLLCVNNEIHNII